MIPFLQKTEGLIEALRTELQHYGEALALLNEQQELIVQRVAGEIITGIAMIEAHSTAMLAARERRSQLQRELAAELQLPGSAILADLIRRLPAQYQPLVQALLEENNQLLFRVQQRARQNHVLLSRSLELMQGLIRSLLPVGAGAVYTAGGDLSAPAFTPAPAFEAVG